MSDLLLAIDYALVIGFLPVLYLSGFFHEVGHAVLGKLGGFVVTSFGMGFGGPILFLRRKEPIIFLALGRPMQGLTWCVFPKLHSPRLPMILMLAGGILANLLLTIAALFAWWFEPYNLLLLVAGINLVLALSNLYPFSFQVGATPLRSDGALILEVLRTGDFATPTSALLATVKAAGPFWTRLGDARIHHIYLLVAASIWHEFGADTLANELCTQAEALPIGEYPFHVAFGAVTRATMTADAAVAESALAQAARLFGDMNNAAGLALVEVSRAVLALKKQEMHHVDDLLRSWSEGPDSAANRQRRISFLKLQLLALETDFSPERFEPLRHCCEQDLSRYLSDLDRLTLNKHLARCHFRLEELPAAEAAYRRALDAAAEIARGLADKDELATFHKSQEPLLSEVGAFLERIGKTEEASKLQTFWEPVKPSQLPKAERKHFSYRLAAAMVVFDLLVGVIVTLGETVADDVPDSRLEAVRNVISLLSLGGAYLGACVGLLSYRFCPSAKWGWISVSFAALPWFCLGVVVAMITNR